MQLLDWDGYVKPPVLAVAEHKARSAATFAAQKEKIGKLCRILRPRSVLCMGAGYLNDIPVDDLVAAGAEIYLAEWMAGVTEQSFRHDLVTGIAGNFVCLACKCSADPKKYCGNYRDTVPPLRPVDGHCDNFQPSEAGTVPLCANYTPGEFPRFLRADVTQGIAEHFARQLSAILRRTSKPKHAFRYAVEASGRPRADGPLPLDDRSVHFITSSLVVSQFDFEPYTYFLRNLFLHFGQQAVEQDLDALNAFVERLRDNLFLAQVEGHCREMLRLLKPDGRIYFSIEALHSSGPSEPFSQPDVFCKAMGVIGRHFRFDLRTMPEIMLPDRTPMVEGGESVIQSYLLVPQR